MATNSCPCQTTCTCGSTCKFKQNKRVCHLLCGWNLIQVWPLFQFRFFCSFGNSGGVHRLVYFGEYILCTSRRTKNLRRKNGLLGAGNALKRDQWPTSLKTKKWYDFTNKVTIVAKSGGFWKQTKDPGTYIAPEQEMSIKSPPHLRKSRGFLHYLILTGNSDVRCLTSNLAVFFGVLSLLTLLLVAEVSS